MFWEYLSQYPIKLYIRITISISLALSIFVLFNSVLQLINGAQFLNTTPLSPSSTCLASASAPAPVIVILPLTRLFASL